MRTAATTTLALALLASGCCERPATAAPESDDIGPDRAAALVEELYGLVSDAPVDVLETRPDGDLYRVVLRQRSARDDGSQVAFLTRDGRYLIEGAVEVERHRRALEAERIFTDCLARAQVRILIQPGAPASEQQLGLLGRAAGRLAVDCTKARDGCDALGVEELPTTVIGDELHPGLRSRAWLEAATACK